MTTYLALGFAIIALVLSGISYLTAAAVAKFVEENNAKSKSLAAIAKVESDLTELHDAYASLLSSHKKLRSRIGMRKIREDKERERANGLPDPTTNPAEWKDEMRRRIHAEKFGK